MFDGKLSLPEAIATLGVIASLVFVGYEIRQSNIIARAEAQNAIAERSLGHAATMALDERYIDAYIADALGEELELSEQVSLEMINFGTLLSWNYAFLTLKTGVVDEGDLVFPKSGNPYYTTRSMSRTWKKHRDNLNPRFVAMWEERFPELIEK